MRDGLYDDTSLALAMTCWSYMSIARNNRSMAVILIDKLFGVTDSGPADVIDMTVRTVTVDTFGMNVTRTLLNNELLDQALINELDAFVPFAIAKRPFCVDFLAARVYGPVAKALKRQLNSGASRFTPHVFLLSARILCFIADASDYFTDMIKTGLLLDVAADGLIIEQDGPSDLWSRLLQPLGHTIGSTYSPVFSNTACHSNKHPEWKRDMHCCNPSCPKQGESGGISTQRCSRCKNIANEVTGDATSPNVKLSDALGPLLDIFVMIFGRRIASICIRPLPDR
ncbi:hypothetical protein PILCRDRAFT_137347 [Piloderma croceum F 1598]|uniref:Uncharacterized protein n=1 Tax=Piloderma croceum (strain F 1598) TaxID=765440 RepID=A0A0C3GMG3_PILCF|nr:hypothetical protein PILCRDRAFT_137347 [Piloderma croceum F 1598]